MCYVLLIFRNDIFVTRLENEKRVLMRQKLLTKIRLQGTRTAS